MIFLKMRCGTPTRSGFHPEMALLFDEHGRYQNVDNSDFNDSIYTMHTLQPAR